MAASADGAVSDSNQQDCRRPVAAIAASVRIGANYETGPQTAGETLTLILETLLMIATFEPRSPLDQWRQRFGGKCRRTQPRPLAAMGYLLGGRVTDGLIEVEKLTIVLLYDEQIRPGHCALRLAGYSGKRVPWGVRFGGPDQCKFFKDLSLQPVFGAHGYRLNLARAELLSLGVALDREMDRHTRHRHIRERVCLPKLWAGFRPEDAAKITADGPELTAYSARSSKPPQYLLERLRRDCFGLTLYPLSWVSHHWQQAVAIYADLERFPRRQVFPLRHDDLIGFHDAAEFDFRSGPQCPFRQWRSKVATSIAG